jgi:predicted DNA-binding transcriptional regulator YafY
MTKSERLLKLIDLLKEHGSISVSDMSKMCRVSSRTIYRDLNTLLRMNVPLKYADGYQLDESRNFVLADLDCGEIEVVLHCLKTSPLSRYPYFQKKLGEIEGKIMDKCRDKINGSVSSVFSREDRGMPMATKSDLDPLEKFTRAVSTRHKVSLRRGAEAMRRSYVPVSVNMTPSGAELVVLRESEGKTTKIPVEEVIDLSVSPDRFDRNAVEKSHQ